MGCKWGRAKGGSSLPGPVERRDWESGQPDVIRHLWEILRTEEPGGLQSIEPQRVRHDRSDLAPSVNQVSATALNILCRELCNLLLWEILSLRNKKHEKTSMYALHTIFYCSFSNGI